ncbi:hypothetical protein C2G38_2181247 [Gigaspora rosea]|uniref:Uncharacterized protein n=1 Tax=Gigaspora rosea TaxID=44941 RepID=A0A397VCU5_9GLOM|nr:hypothetical protein C2G38_2181247 [Gigaspora rosea]
MKMVRRERKSRNDSVEKVESIEIKTINVLNTDIETVNKAKIENLPEGLNKGGIRNNEVEVTHCQESNNREIISEYNSEHYIDKENQNKRDENEVLICYKDACDTDIDLKEILEEDLKQVEGETSIQFKLEDDERLVFDPEKIWNNNGMIGSSKAEKNINEDKNLNYIRHIEMEVVVKDLLEVLIEDKLDNYEVYDKGEIEVDQYDIPAIVKVENDNNGNKALYSRAKSDDIRMKNIKKHMIKKISCHDELLACDLELAMKTEDNGKGRLYARNKVDKLGYNGVKGERIEAKNDNFDEEIMKHVENDYVDYKKKLDVSKENKHKATQVETKNKKKYTREVKSKHLLEIQIR